MAIHNQNAIQLFTWRQYEIEHRVGSGVLKLKAKNRTLSNGCGFLVIKLCFFMLKRFVLI